MLKVPDKFAVVGIQRHGRAGEQCLIARLSSAARPHPRLGLCDSPICFIEVRIVTASNPRLAAGAHQARNRAPGVTSQLSLARHSLKLPELLAGRRVVPADKAAVLPELRASHQTLDDFSMDHERSARVAVA